ncbi:hypothetical protein HDR66_03765 [bacterium]|nr:hypothetical protein [bacterium]
MKGFKLLFAGMVGLITIGIASADDAASVARAARRNTNTTTQAKSQTGATSSRTRPTSNTTHSGTTSTQSRATTTQTRGTASRTSGTDTSRGTSGATRTGTTTTGVTTRAGGAVSSRGAVTTTSSRGTTPISRAATTTATRTGTTATTARAGASKSRTSGGLARAARASVVRAAENASELRNVILNRDYTTCRKVYYECMDEFCANKDAQLKRCACSSRIHEFDRVKQQLASVEDKMLDFNQRLLTVNMDKEDVAAMVTATEGELAFAQTDKSESQKILDSITNKLKTSGTDTFTNMSPISLSLNIDSAFDSVDSMMGADTATKEGVALYNAALPVCVEMAREVCEDDTALSIAQSGYQMQIEQDCNTVARTYETQTDKAREKIREGGALLDMSRLDIHQQRNSDDILTCKQKMLDQLSDTSVCGANLGRCLDISGQYIDPTTGSAFLTENLGNLTTLLTRPGENQTWSSNPNNEKFVKYLTSKKKYLEPATENCQDIADTVWDEFIDDALAQIKLAQDNKLEEVRQSCTTLVTECLTKAGDSLAAFDARALSTFGILADKTAASMCQTVNSACTALLKTSSDSAGTDWNTGMDTITRDKAYATLLSTCREVGKNCIIQVCKSSAGNFGLCENNGTNRGTILEADNACWQQVQECVASAGDDVIASAVTDNEITNGFFAELYGPDYIEQICNTQTKQCSLNPNKRDISSQCSNICTGNMTNDDANKLACRTCRLTEKIWGNCELEANSNTGGKNKIMAPKDSTQSTLLYWFAENTGTASDDRSCYSKTTCDSTERYDSTQGKCVPKSDFTADGQYCPKDNRFEINTALQNCCSAGNIIVPNVCCVNGTTPNKTDVSAVLGLKTGTAPEWNLCVPNDLNVFYLAKIDETKYLACITAKEDNIKIKPSTNVAADAELTCGDEDEDGYFVYIYSNGKIISATDGAYPTISATTNQNTTYQYYEQYVDDYNTGWGPEKDKSDSSYPRVNTDTNSFTGFTIAW